MLCALLAGLVVGEGDAAARAVAIVAAPIVASEATPAPDAKSPKQCSAKVQAIVVSLCTAIENNAVGYEPEIVTTIGDLLAADYQVSVRRQADGTYTLTSRDVAAGRDFKTLTDQTPVMVANWKASDIDALLPQIGLAVGAEFSASPLQKQSIIVVADDPVVGTLYDGLMIQTLQQRGIAAIESTATADELHYGGACLGGETHLFYRLRVDHRDRASIGFSRDNSTVSGTLASCDSSFHPISVAGQDSSKYFKSADKTSLLGFTALLFPKFAWGAITPLAALGLSLGNVSDSQDVLTADSVERSMQRMVDNLCISGPPVPCNNHPLTRFGP